MLILIQNITYKQISFITLELNKILKLCQYLYSFETSNVIASLRVIVLRADGKLNREHKLLNRATLIIYLIKSCIPRGKERLIKYEMRLQIILMAGSIKPKIESACSYSIKHFGSYFKT